MVDKNALDRCMGIRIIREELMMKLRFFTLICLLGLILLTACGGNKQVETSEPVPMRNPLALAHEQAARGNEAYGTQQYTEAIQAFNEAITLFNEAAPKAMPSDSISLNLEKMNLNIAKSYIELAGESHNDSMYDEAITNYESALGIYKNITPVNITREKLDENILGVYNNLAITCKEAGKFEDAVKYYDQILVMHPGDPEILNAKFYVLRDNIKDETRAYTVLKDYADASKDPAAYINLAERYEDRGNTVEAEKYYLKAVELRPDGDMYRRLANFYRNTSNWAKANTYLEKVLLTSTDQNEQAKVYVMIGKNYEQLKDTNKMVEYYNKSVAIDRDPQIALYLASYYNKLKSWQNVIKFATITLASETRNVDAIMLRGNAYYQSKNYTAARADLERIQNDPKYGANIAKMLKAMPKK